MKPARKHVINPLTGLRGVTILSVIVLHFGGYITTLLPGLTPLVSFSSRVVFRMDLFFMLSGFILSYVFISPAQRLTLNTYGRFLRGRFFRLYPSYLAALALLAAFVVVCTRLGLPLKGDYPLNAVPFRLALLQSWPFMQWGVWTWNYPTWFLSALTFGYVFTFPFFWLLIHRLRYSRWAYLWIFGPILVWAAVWRINQLHEFHMLIRVSCEMLAGCALYVLYLDGSRFISLAQKHLDKIAVTFLVAALVLAADPPRLLRGSINSLLELGLPFLLAGMTAETSLTARLLASRPLLWLGGISYGLFLTHGVTQRFLEVFLPAERFLNQPFFVRWPVAAVYVVSVVGAAFALHKWVELPVVALFKRRRQEAIEENLATGARAQGEHPPSQTGKQRASFPASRFALTRESEPDPS